jgi:hypothetical protein
MRLGLQAAARVTFIGPNGSGKSFLALGYVAKMRSAIVVDPKHEIELPGFRISHDPVQMRLSPRVIWRPPGTMAERDVADAAGYAAMCRNNTTLYVDEIGAVCNATAMGDWLKAAIRMGRSKGVGVWGATQRPKDVHNLWFSEAWTLLVSPLLAGFDRDKVRGFVADDYIQLVTQEWPPYTWYLYHRGNRTGEMIRAG